MRDGHAGGRCAPIGRFERRASVAVGRVVVLFGAARPTDAYRQSCTERELNRPVAAPLLSRG
ncbi:hypothetical protein EYF80_050057 [Liparis tanakae]|uniref:Uncharacterized protein n=1 Tax=Liparis tanakae TaxID=230148 RepID=A0A4Z2FF55_9TELE|nr:hypothetical protein EYF80_050057 [Liparis tanakae]